MSADVVFTKEQTDAMADEAFNTLKRLAGITESEKDIIQDCGSVRLRIYEDGEYKDKDTKEVIQFDEGIELKCGGARVIVHASDLALLVHHMKSNPEVRDILRKRFKVEQDILKGLSL